MPAKEKKWNNNSFSFFFLFLIRLFVFFFDCDFCSLPVSPHISLPSLSLSSLFVSLYLYISFSHLGVSSMPQVQLIQPDPHPHQFVEAVLDEGVIDGILNMNLPDEQL